MSSFRVIKLKSGRADSVAVMRLVGVALLVLTVGFFSVRVYADEPKTNAGVPYVRSPYSGLLVRNVPKPPIAGNGARAGGGPILRIEKGQSKAGGILKYRNPNFMQSLKGARARSTIKGTPSRGSLSKHNTTGARLSR